MQVMKEETLRKCCEAVILVYEKGYTLKAAAKLVKISSQTIYTYVDDLPTDEGKLLRNISKQNASRK